MMRKAAVVVVAACLAGCIAVERPDAEAARDIFSKYVVRNLPLPPDDLAEHSGSATATVEEMIQRVVERMYSETQENQFLEVTYANGDKEVLYFKDRTSLSPLA